jgi:hypothetical protein
MLPDQITGAQMRLVERTHNNRIGEVDYSSSGSTTTYQYVYDGSSLVLMLNGVRSVNCG